VRKTLLNSCCGYSFIELLVALAILGLVSAPVLALFTGSFSSIAEAGRRSSAVNLCREKMETVKAGGYEAVYSYYIAAGGSPHVEEEIPGQPLFRRTTVVKALDPTENGLPPGSDLLSIKITVSWTAGERELSESLVSRLAGR